MTTDPKPTEAEMMRSPAVPLEPEQFRRIVEHSPDFICELDSESRYLYVSPNYQSVLGYEPSTLLGRTSYELGIIHPDDLQGLAQPSEDLFIHHRNVRTEYRARNASGEWRWFESHSSPVRDASGNWRAVVFSRDITQRKLDEEKFSKIYRLSPDAITLTRISDGLYIDVNEGFTRSSGWHREEVIGRTAMEMDIWVDPKDRAKAVQLILESGEFVELEARFRRKDLTIFYGLMSARILELHGEIHMLAVTRDISERKRMEEALRASEENYRELVELAVDGILQGDPNRVITGANSRACEITGFTQDELLGKPISCIFSHSEMARVPLRFDLLNEGKTLMFERILTRSDGTTVPIEMHSKRMPDGTYHAFIRDIGERRRGELALRESEDRFRSLYNNTADSMFCVRVAEDGTFLIEDINPAQEAILGLRCADVVGKTFHQFLADDLANDLVVKYRHCIALGHALRYEETAEFPLGHRVFDTHLIPIRNAEGRIYRIVGTSRDITEAKQSEETLRQAQKLESLGVLAGGIAHDFNNLLSAMLGNLNLAQMNCPVESPAQSFLDSVERTILRASELTKQMLAYSGKGRFVVAPQDMNRVVQEMTHLLSVSIPKKVALHFEPSPDLPSFEADAAQIQQVIMNMVTNASDAIGESEGAIRVSTRFEQLDESIIQSKFPNQNLSPGPCVVLEVADSGCGMSPEIRDKIFDPFFTTKLSGRGLGLSAMLGILRGHHAGIHITSEVGSGSTFTLYFPASSHPLPKSAERPTVQAQPAFAGLRVLLADDETVVRESTQAMLQSMGFVVTTSVDGQEAVDYFRKGLYFDLVILDLSMPRMDGLEAFSEIQRLRPGIPVIIYSGYSERDWGSDAQITPAGFLQKPFQLKDLKSTIQSVLKR